MRRIDTGSSLYCLKVSNKDEYIVHIDHQIEEELIYLFDDLSKATEYALKYGAVSSFEPVIIPFDASVVKRVNSEMFLKGVFVNAKGETEYVAII